MSISSPTGLREALRAAAQRADVRLEARPLVDLGWMASAAVRLTETPAKTLRLLQRDPRTITAPASATLVWSPSPSPEEVTWRWADERLLLAFAGLSVAPASQILTFARRWGPLWLCGHGLPASHRSAEWLLDRDPFGRCEAIRDPPREDVDLWRRYATEAAAVVEVVTSLRKQCPVPLAMWDPISHLQGDEPFGANVAWPLEERGEKYWTSKDLRPSEVEERDQILADQHEALSIWLNWWLDISGARPHYDPMRNGIVPVVHPTLFAAIAFQLASLMSGPEWLIKCHACGEYEERDAKPQAGRRAYCSLCRERGRRRDWARENPPPTDRAD